MPDLTIELAGETVVLLPERALFWPRRAALLIADPHWGKAAAFRAAGLAIPGGTTAGDLLRLGRALERTGAERLFILGDLLHARSGRAPATLAAITEWRHHHAEIDITFVPGNHDRRAGDPPPEWAFRAAAAPLLAPPFALLHAPAEVPAGYALAGHLHPAARLRGAGRQRLRLPCFWFGPRVGVLPAFGSFTGSAEVVPAPADRVFVLAEDEILAIR